MKELWADIWMDLPIEAQFMADAVATDDGGWTKHTEHRWSRTVAGKRLEYWPSSKKFRYDGRVRRGDVWAFIRSKT